MYGTIFQLQSRQDLSLISEKFLILKILKLLHYVFLNSQDRYLRSDKEFKQSSNLYQNDISWMNFPANT